MLEAEVSTDISQPIADSANAAAGCVSLMSETAEGWSGLSVESQEALIEQWGEMINQATVDIGLGSEGAIPEIASRSAEEIAANLSEDLRIAGLGGFDSAKSERIKLRLEGALLGQLATLA